MGNCQSGDGVVQPQPPKIEVQRLSDNEEDAQDFFKSLPNRQELRDYLDAFQDANFRRLRDSFKKDMELFILNQLLLSTQFFQNFETSMEEAKTFKGSKEKELNDELAGLTGDGVIGGDRRLFLLHGMSEILATNYIYKPQKPGDSVPEATDSHWRKKLKPSVYVCEGILPLEFTLNYDNYEVYTEKEWQYLKENDYSTPDSPIFRFQMEEPNEDNRVPRGYVRLLSEDSHVQKNNYSSTAVPASTNSYDYSNTSEIYGDRISEAKSSCASSLASEVSDDEGDSTANMNEGEKFLHHLNKRIGERAPPPISRFNVTRPASSPSTTANLLPLKPALKAPLSPRLKAPLSPRFEAPLSPRLKASLSPRLIAPLSPSLHPINDTEQTPKIMINGARSSLTPPTTPTEINGYGSGLLSPLWTPIRNRGSDREDKAEDAISSLRTAFQSHPDNLSNADSSNSMLSASFSANIRRKPLELKELWQYQRKHNLVLRKDSGPTISQDCLIQVKIEKDEYEDEEEDDESSSEESSRRGRSVSSNESDFILRSYLNSTQFSAYVCSDFNIFAPKIGVKTNSLQKAQVLGASIHCPMEYTLRTTPLGEMFQVRHTITPILQCKQWPPKSLLWFRNRLLSTEQFIYSHGREPVPKPERMFWPSRSQVESIEAFGCGLIPQGFHSVDFFNAQQSMEWLVNFTQAENLLLNSFKNAHWRAYIMTAILFRAYIFPLGPRGIDLIHIRHIMFHMCEQDYDFWNDEECGLQLRFILSRLEESLGKKKLPSFFIPRYDMFRGAAPENIQTIQARLSQINGNIIIYFIKALQNVICARAEKDFYPQVNLNELYTMITGTEKDLLKLGNPWLDTSPAETSPKKNKHLDKNFEIVIQDRQQQRQKKRWHRWQTQQQAKKQAVLEAKRLQIQRELSILSNNSKSGKKPDKLAEPPIDLNQMPVTKFNNRRSVMIIEFFVVHFLKMAKTALTFKAYVEATTYTLHVQNLCRLMQGIKLNSTHMDDTTILSYMRQAEDLRNSIGPKLYEYVRSKLTRFETPNGTSVYFLNNNTLSPNAIPPHDNVILKPQTRNVSPPSRSRVNRFEFSAIGASLQSFPMQDSSFSPTRLETDFHEDLQYSPLDNLVRPKRQHLRYIQSSNNIRYPHNHLGPGQRSPRTSFQTRNQNDFRRRNFEFT